MLIGFLALGAFLAYLLSQKHGLHWRAPQPQRVDLPLAARVVGRSDKAILFLHGLAGSGRYFGATYDSLATSGWSVVVPDLLGFGRSRGRGETYDLEEHLSALESLLDAVGVREVIIVGHSTGCVLALALAHRVKTHAIVAIAPVVYEGPDQATEHLAAMGPWVRHFALQTPIAQRTCAWMCRHRGLAGWLAVGLRMDLPAPVARDGVQHTWRSYSQTLEHVIIRSRSARLMEGLDVPVLLVAGEGDPAMAREVLDRLSKDARATLHVLEGGHDLPLRRTSDCLALIRSVVPGQP